MQSLQNISDFLIKSGKNFLVKHWTYLQSLDHVLLWVQKKSGVSHNSGGKKIPWLEYINSKNIQALK